MKAAGVSAQEIIAKQIERHTAFHLKNAYSKDKYKKRKEQKCVFLPPPLPLLLV
jgi:tRNA (adenine-N(1)-)-methyltransferase non-catalytic subunit